MSGSSNTNSSLTIAAQLAKAHYFDNSAAKKDFGYAPEIDNKEGLKRTLAWLKESGTV